MQFPKKYLTFWGTFMIDNIFLFFVTCVDICAGPAIQSATAIIICVGFLYLDNL